jgi:hypothetical protein
MFVSPNYNIAPTRLVILNNIVMTTMAHCPQCPVYTGLPETRGSRRYPAPEIISKLLFSVRHSI